MYTRDGLAYDTTVKEKNIDEYREKRKFSEFTLVGEVARYLNISCLTVAKILRESVDGLDTIIEKVNQYNDVLYGYVIPAVFHALFEIKSKRKSEEKEFILLHEPKEAGFYEFSANPNLVLTNKYQGFTKEELSQTVDKFI